MRKSTIILITLIVSVCSFAQEMTKDSLLLLSQKALGLDIIDSLKTMSYDLKIKSDSSKQEFSIQAKGKRRIAAVLQNSTQSTTYIRNGANYFIEIDSITLNLESAQGRKNLNGYNFARGLDDLLDGTDDMELQGLKSIDDRDCWHLKSKDDKTTVHLYIDKETYLPVRRRFVKKNNQNEVTKLQVTNFSDFITVAGVTIPGKQRVSYEQDGKTQIQVIQVSNVQIGIEIPNSRFKAQ